MLAKIAEWRSSDSWKLGALGPRYDSDRFPRHLSLISLMTVE